MHNPGDLFCSLLLELSVGIWHSWHGVLSGKDPLPWLCGCLSYWFFYFTGPIFSVSFSDSSSCSPLQTQVLGARRSVAVFISVFPSKALREFHYTFDPNTLTFPLDHSYASFKAPLVLSSKPLGWWECTLGTSQHLEYNSIETILLSCSPACQHLRAVILIACSSP